MTCPCSCMCGGPGAITQCMACASKPTYDKLLAERDKMLFATYLFCEEVDQATAYINRPKGGQTVGPPSGDFINMPPHMLSRVVKWADRFKEDGGHLDYAVTYLNERVASLESENYALQRNAKALKFAKAMAEGDCSYGDNCPVYGRRHGRCISCQAKLAIL